MRVMGLCRTGLLAAIVTCSLVMGLPPSVRAEVPDAWLTHDDPFGFSLRYPPTWTVEIVQNELVSVSNADGTIFVIVQPFFARDGVTAEGRMWELPDKLTAVFPHAVVDDMYRVSSQPDEVVAELDFDDRGEAGRALVMCTLDGRSGMLYAIAAPDRAFDKLRGVLIDVLTSLSFETPTATLPDASGVTYVKWHEPNEGAFTLEVPQGWQVSGGLYRENALDFRPDVRITSPDGRMLYRIGDQNIPPYTGPRWSLEVAGFTEGSWYSYMGMTWMVRSYVSGLDFAREYLMQNLPADCASATIIDERDRSDLSQPINEIYGRFNLYGGSITVDTGQVLAECSVDGESVYIYCFAGTKLTKTPDVELWNVEYLVYGVIPASEGDAGQAILGHIANSYELNQQWVHRQAEVAGEVGDTVARVAGEIREITRRTFEAESEARYNAARRWSNMILGQTDVMDPVTGETWRVANGHNYYWRRGDTVVGTDIDRPNVDFTPLVEW